MRGWRAPFEVVPFFGLMPLAACDEKGGDETLEESRGGVGVDGDEVSDDGARGSTSEGMLGGDSSAGEALDASGCGLDEGVFDPCASQACDCGNVWGSASRSTTPTSVTSFS